MHNLIENVINEFTLMHNNVYELFCIDLYMFYLKKYIYTTHVALKILT